MRALRIAAMGIAAVGVVDPPWTLRQRPPVPVALVADDAAQGSAARRALEARLGTAVTFESADEPAAVVLIGGRQLSGALKRDEVPVSTIASPEPSSPNVRIVEAHDPAPVRAGWAATVEAIVDARGLAGKTSTIVLEAHGTELSRTTHTWASDVEQFTASLRYTPPRAGASIVTVRANPIEGETTGSDNAADLRLTAIGRQLRILVHEPRPSWNATFLRRALEDDPTFDVSTFVQASKGLAVRTGTPPPILTADALNGFDAVVIGAPEELRAPEVDALRLFARRRGGAVVFVPDRRPAGRYLDLLPSAQFEEVLVDDAVALGSVAGGRLRASEIAVYRGSDTTDGNVLASLEQNKSTRPVVLEWLAGEGRVILSGALDAWRYRGDPDEGFARFWRARLAEAAQAAPARLAVSFAPGAPGVGEEVVVRVRLRPTELNVSGGITRVPAVNAQLIDGTGRATAVRVWPTAEPGTFATRIKFAEAGTFDLKVGTETGAVVDDVITVASVAHHPTAPAEGSGAIRNLVAGATGGVAIGSDSDLVPLAEHLRGLSAGEVPRVVHPWRSFWAVTPFVALLSVEWAIRRRRGHP